MKKHSTKIQYTKHDLTGRGNSNDMTRGESKQFINRLEFTVSEGKAKSEVQGSWQEVQKLENHKQK